MSWDLDTAKGYLGITGTDQDAAITNVMAYTLESLELVLQRKLEKASDVKTFKCVTGDNVLLPRYPVESIASVDSESSITDYGFDASTGIMYFPYGYYKTITVDYNGGYDPLPVPLERAMWDAFMLAWANSDQTTGGPPVPVTGTSGEDPELKAVTVYDGFKLEYHATGSDEEDTSSIDRKLMWGWLYPWSSIFQMYRSEHGVGTQIV